MVKISRRAFNVNLSLGIGGLITAGMESCIPSKEPSNSYKGEKLGVALVGLGTYSTFELAPSLLETDYCYLAGIVTGTPEKAIRWAKEYQLPPESIYNYENFDGIKSNDAIDIIYVVLPNALHAEFCIRAAKAGKHVICEKPMAVSVEECDAIIDACKSAGVKCSVGYRLHSEPYTKKVKQVVRDKEFGEIKYVAADAAYHSTTDPDQWRLNKALSGGGALMNMGVYSIQSLIYGAGQNPINVTGQEFSTRPKYFKDTDETITAQFEFPNGAIGNLYTSHNSNSNRLFASFQNGWLELNPANNYGPLSGRTSAGEILEFPHRRQQALQMDDFARHILEGTTNVAPAEMGKRDMIIVEAIYKSIQDGGAKIALDLGSMGL